MSASMYVHEYPLSDGQRALWLLYRMAPEGVAYSGAVAVPGNTNLDALHRAFRRLAERHPMLRTLFAAPDGEPVQRVTPYPDVDFRCEDASDVSPAQLDERLALEMYHPFDLEHGPAWRVLVLQRAPIPKEDTDNSSLPEHLVLLVLHHILGDLWSIAVMMSEAAALYREEATGIPASLSPLRTSGDPLSAGELRSFLRDRLPRPMLPETFVMLDSLPLLPNGKLDRRALQVFAEAAREPERAVTPPYTSLEHHLAQLWKELLKLEQVGVHDDFFALGGNSLLGAVLVNRLGEALRENVSLVASFDAPTISELASYLEERHPDGVARLLGAPIPIPSERKANAEAAVLPPALVPIQPEGTRPPLFCIHPAGGTVFPYYTLVPHLGKDQPLYGIQDPGLYDQQSPFTSIEDMAAAYLGALKTVQSNGPYHLMGWSVGGVVAYEMAQQLMRQGQMVAALIMLDTYAPARRKPLEPQAPLRTRLQRMASWAQVLPHRIKETGSAVHPILSYMHSGLFLMAASARRKRAPADKKPTARDLLWWAGMDSWRARQFKEAEVATTVSRETSLLLVEMPAVRQVLELVREHTRLARRYCAEAYRGRITLFRAVPKARRVQQAGDSAMGWGKLAGSGVEIHPIQANHVALLVKPYVEVLAQELRVCLDRARQTQPIFILNRIRECVPDSFVCALTNDSLARSLYILL